MEPTYPMLEVEGSMADRDERHQGQDLAEWLRDLLRRLGELLEPEPEPVPVPVRPGRPRRRPGR